MLKSIFYSYLTISLIFINSLHAQKKESYASLSPSDFAERINKNPSPTIVDVRTPEEFSKGHIKNATNIDWNSGDFQSKISKLDKSKPVFVYCLSGGRSSAAVNQMSANGFKQIYELSGGIMKWRAANLPETNSNITTGMTKLEFDKLINSNKLVLVDFYADWCAPCKKMKPYLDEMAKDMSDKLIVVRINADENQKLCKELKVSSLPVLQLYKNKAIKWKNSGYISKEEVLKHLQ